MAGTLIVDWDGTITERDSLLMVLEQFGDWEESERLGEELFAGKITLREEIERQFATVHASAGRGGRAGWSRTSAYALACPSSPRCIRSSSRAASTS